MKLSTTLKHLLTHATPRPQSPVLSLVAGSDLEEQFAGLWKSFGNGLRPVREYRFAKTLGRNWRFDFAWPEQMVAVELEGLTFEGAGGRHQRAAGFSGDCEKYNCGVMLGWAVLRFTAHDLKRRPLPAIDMVRTLLDAAEGEFGEDC